MEALPLTCVVSSGWRITRLVGSRNHRLAVPQPSTPGFLPSVIGVTTARRNVLLKVVSGALGCHPGGLWEGTGLRRTRLPRGSTFPTLRLLWCVVVSVD